MREKVLATCLEVSPSIDFSSNELVDGGLLDSVTLVEIVTELMDVFDIEIPYEEVTPENFNSIDSMVKLVEKYV